MKVTSLDRNVKSRLYHDLNRTVAFGKTSYVVLRVRESELSRYLVNVSCNSSSKMNLSWAYECLPAPYHFDWQFNFNERKSN